MLLVLDAAYAEYMIEADYRDGLELAREAENVMVLRTFSKIYALAGLRLGWGYGSPRIIDVVNRVRGTFNVTTTAQTGGDGGARGSGRGSTRCANTRSLGGGGPPTLCAKSGLDVPDSVGNFVLCRFPGAADADAADAFLRRRGLIVRKMAGYGLGESLRITIGTEEEMRLLVDGFAAFQSEHRRTILPRRNRRRDENGRQPSGHATIRQIRRVEEEQEMDVKTRDHRVLLGNEAISRGLAEAGCQFITAYPGTPSSEILPAMVEFGKELGLDLYAEWSTNEKVALETALAAAYSGKRAAVAMKQVGLNVAADPALSAAYIGVVGGLVLIVADDPGLHSSQTEQDSRLFSLFSKIPALDPSSPQEAKEMVLRPSSFPSAIRYRCCCGRRCGSATPNNRSNAGQRMRRFEPPI